ncbi:MAG: TIGR02147 family protein [Pseudobdellovibrionaceae bacterium]
MGVEPITSPLPYPQITKYNSYRAFLSDMIEHKKSIRSQFSFRGLSQKVGLKSPNYIQLVLQGKRNLTTATAERICKVLLTSKSETEYFLALVGRDNAVNLEDQKKAEKALFCSASKILTKSLSEDQQEIISEWHHLLVRELVFFKDFKMEGEWASHKLGGLISPEQAGDSLSLLVRAGFFTDNNGKWEATDPVLNTGTEVFFHHQMQMVHQKVLRFWAHNIESLGSAKEQDLAVLNIPIPKDKIPELKSRLSQFHGEIIGWCQSFKDCDQMTQLGTYLMVYPEKKL